MQILGKEAIRYETYGKEKAISGIFLLLWLGFIWGNSLLPGTDSAAVSGFVGELLSLVFGPWVLEATYLLRKLAHFTEFALLGGLLAWNGKLWQKPGAALPALAGLLAAMTDESIQLLSPGRASMVTDVWIDFAGVVTGITIYRLLSRRKITR